MHLLEEFCYYWSFNTFRMHRGRKVLKKLKNESCNITNLLKSFKTYFFSFNYNLFLFIVAKYSKIFHSAYQVNVNKHVSVFYQMCEFFFSYLNGYIHSNNWQCNLTCLQSLKCWTHCDYDKDEILCFIFSFKKWRNAVVNCLLFYYKK